MGSIDFRTLADDIVAGVGGKDNVAAVSHCATRLRFQLKDDARANKAKVEQLKGVITVVEAGGQFQVVIGNNVPKVYAELGALTHLQADAPKGNIFNRFIAMISAIFSPILWPLAGTGLLKAFLALFVQLKWLDATTQSYTILYAASDALINFLPIVLAVTAARYFKADQFTSMAIGGALVYPSIIALNTGDPVSFFGIPVVMFSYVSSVIPIIVAVWVQSHLERVLKKALPEMIRNFTTPLITVLVMVPLVLLTIGPAASLLGKAISGAVVFLFGAVPPFGAIIGGAIMGAFWQVFVIFGLHWGFIPVLTNDLGTLGYSVLAGALPAAVSAQAAATLAVLFKTRNKDLKELAGPAAVSGFLAGITEPAIYGVTLRLKKPFIYGCVGGAIGGAIACAGGSAASAMVMPSVMALPAYMSVGNFALQVIGTLAAIVIAAGLTMVLGFKDPIAEAAPVADGSVSKDVAAPVAGRIVPLSEVGDKVFASGALGNGLGIVPSSGAIVAPFDGVVVTLTDTLHAVGLRSHGGVELLIHVGIDTVKLAGRGFTAAVKAGDEVKAGDLLITADLAAIEAAGYDTTTVLAVTNSTDFTEVNPVGSGTATPGTVVIAIAR